MSAFALLSLAACGSGHEQSAGGGGQQQMQQQAPKVDTITAEQTTVESVRSLPARVQPFAEAEIRPQVSGLIQSRLFTEGQQVEEGEALYQIEASEYAAAVESAEAALARAEATAENARQDAKRLERLANVNAVSQQTYDQAVAAQKQAEADVGMQKAALQRARIDLARTKIRSPISGQIGRSRFTPGALVTASQAEPLARVVQLDPIYVDMTAASSEVLKWRQDVAQGQIQTIGEGQVVPVTVRLEDGEEYPIRGKLEFSEVSVDQEAGTVIVRAQVPNPDGLILPGMFVKAEFSAGQLEGVILVPQRAVQRTPKGEPYVFVVSDEGTAEQAMIETDGTQGSDWIVTSGLESGQRVIVSGFQRVRAGAPVEVAGPDPSNMTAMTREAKAVTPE
ncbi:efflux RND transporter periplasmic adaptor subunit [Henriciella aquimarina]|uniref:efflux RND transporter periplasmic adaptor subunit n=1 Tax=Henriciella aquimarina TaxID=545261 RepID=UPI001301B7B0|nr:efflux RND transporter periplasmic adaptor subunit [Henriciella aquimarina]